MNRKAFGASLERDIKLFRKELKKAKKNPGHCKVAGRALLNVGFAAGGAYAEMRGIYRKKVTERRVHGAAHARTMKALSAFDKVCMRKKKK
jgi:hypothetical protein